MQKSVKSYYLVEVEHDEDVPTKVIKDKLEFPLLGIIKKASEIDWPGIKLKAANYDRLESACAFDSGHGLLKLLKKLTR